MSDSDFSTNKSSREDPKAEDSETLKSPKTEDSTSGSAAPGSQTPKPVEGGSKTSENSAGDPSTQGATAEDSQPKQKPVDADQSDGSDSSEPNTTNITTETNREKTVFSGVNNFFAKFPKGSNENGIEDAEETQEESERLNAKAAELMELLPERSRHQTHHFDDELCQSNFERLKSLRMGVVSCLDSTMLKDAGQQLANLLRDSGYKNYRVSATSENENLGRRFSAGTFLKASTQGVQEVIIFHVSSSEMLGFARKTLEMANTEFPDQLRDRSTIFLFLYYPDFFEDRSATAPSMDLHMWWQIVAERELLSKHGTIEEVDCLLDNLAAQQKKRLWPMSKLAFYRDIKKIIGDDGGIHRLEDKLKEKEQNSYRERITKVDEPTRKLIARPVCRALLFTTTYLPGLPVNACDEIVKCLSEGEGEEEKSEEVTIEKSYVKDGKAVNETETKTVPIDSYEYYLKNKDSLWRKCEINLFPNERNQFMVDFEEGIRREVLRPLPIWGRFTYDAFERIYRSKVLFNLELPNSSVRVLTEYFARMIPAFDNDRKSGWLMELVDFIDDIERLKDTEVERAERSSGHPLEKFVNAYRVQFNHSQLRSFLIARVAELCRAVLQLGEEGELTIKQFFNRLTEHHSDDTVVLRLAVRLRYEEGFSITAWIRQVFERGKASARVSALYQLTSESAQSPQRFIEVFELTREWIQEDPDAEKPFGKYGLVFLPAALHRAVVDLKPNQTDQTPFDSLLEHSPEFSTKLVEVLSSKRIAECIRFAAKDEWENKFGFRDIRDDFLPEAYLASVLYAHARTYEGSQNQFFEVMKEFSAQVEEHTKYNMTDAWLEILQSEQETSDDHLIAGDNDKFLETNRGIEQLNCLISVFA